MVGFPFTDNVAQTKPRPALCLTEPIGKYNEIVVAFITSKIPYHKLPTDFTFSKNMDGFETAGLSHSSTIRLHKLSTVNAENVTQVFGKIEDIKTLHTIQRKLRNFFFYDLTKLSEEEKNDDNSTPPSQNLF